MVMYFPDTPFYFFKYELILFSVSDDCTTCSFAVLILQFVAAADSFMVACFLIYLVTFDYQCKSLGLLSGVLQGEFTLSSARIGEVLT